MNELKVIEQRNVLGKDFKIYGDFDNPLFLAKDVAEMIEYSTDKVGQMLVTVDEFEKKTLPIYYSGQVREMWFVTEEGLYEVLFQSIKPIAKEFKKEVKIILKDIRKHGIYATDKVIENILNNPDYGIALLTQLKEERQARLEAEKTNTILMHVNKTYTATELGKELGFKSAIALNKTLSDNKIQFKQNETWVFYSKYANCGYTEIKQTVLDSGKVVYDRRFTQLGREFIIKLLNK
jgi:prophage antirepressor-like protein